MSVGSLIGMVVGGVVGWFAGGPYGAYVGAAMGFSLGMMVDPLTPDVDMPGVPTQLLQASSNRVGDPIIDGLGTVKIAGGHMLFYGKERSIVIYEHVDTGGKGGGKKQKAEKARQYYASWGVGILLGPVDALYGIYKDEKLVWEGELIRPLSGGEETIIIGDTIGGIDPSPAMFLIPPEGSGEYMGPMTFYFGTHDHALNSKVAAILTEIGMDTSLNYSYRGLCWAFFDNCYVGDYNRIPSMSFVVRKTPTVSFGGGHQIQTCDYNPSHAAWHIFAKMTGLPEAWLHAGDFADVASVLSGENRGVSILFNRQQNAGAYLESLNGHVDMILRYGTDGTFHPKLIRNDYVVADLPLIDESVVPEEPEFSRGSWIETINEVKAEYSKRTFAPLIVSELIFQVSTPPDNGQIVNEIMQFNPGADPYHIGQGPTGFTNHTWQLFRNVTIPVGAIIQSAYLQFKVRVLNVPKIRIYGEDGTNPSPPASFLDYLSKDLTSAYVDWDLTSTIDYEWKDSPDISSIIQEIINNPGWASGNNLQLLPHNNGSAYENYAHIAGCSSAPELAARLVVEYGLAEITGTVDIKQSMADPVAVDIGNKDVQGRIVSKTINLPMLSTNANAVWAEHQHLLKISYPFAALRFFTNRNAFRYEVGDAFKFSYSASGISQMICRVLVKEEEDIESERIVINAMEDFFSVGNVVTIFTDPVSHTLSAPDYTVSPFDHQIVIEAPFVINDTVAIIAVACRKSLRDLGFEIYMSLDGGTSYLYVETVTNVKPFGTLVGSYPITYTIDNETGFTVEFANDDVDLIETATWAEIFAGQRNTALIVKPDGTYEIISFRSITPVTGYQYKLEDVIRGRYGTERMAHITGEEFYFVDLKIMVVEHSEILAGVSRSFKLVPYNNRQVGDISSSTPVALNVTGVSLTPYKPINFAANGVSFASRYDTDVVLTWSPRYRGKGAGIGIPGEILADSDREGLFSVEVWVGGVKVRETSGIDAATWTYTEAMNLSDNGTLAATIVFKLTNYRTEDGYVYECAPTEVACKKNQGGLS